MLKSPCTFFLRLLIGVPAVQQTPLHVAVIQGNRDAIRLLRNAGADPTIRDSAGMIPMA